MSCLPRAGKTGDDGRMGEIRSLLSCIVASAVAGCSLWGGGDPGPVTLAELPGVGLQVFVSESPLPDPGEPAWLATSVTVTHTVEDEDYCPTLAASLDGRINGITYESIFAGGRESGTDQCLAPELRRGFPVEARTGTLAVEVWDESLSASASFIGLMELRTATWVTPTDGVIAPGDVIRVAWAPDPVAAIDESALVTFRRIEVFDHEVANGVRDEVRFVGGQDIEIDVPVAVSWTGPTEVEVHPGVVWPTAETCTGVTTCIGRNYLRASAIAEMTAPPPPP